MLLRPLLVVLACCCVGYAVTPAQAQQVHLGWDSPLQVDGTPIPDLAGYRLYYGLQSGQYQTMVPVGMTTTHTVTNLSAGQTYYFSVKAYTTVGIESGFSNEVSVTLSLPQPEGSLIPQQQIRVVSVDSQDMAGGNYAAANALDGNAATMWHSEWFVRTPPLPHTLVLDLGGHYLVDGLRYVPRQDGNPNGTIIGYAFYVSDDGITWGSAAATGTFAANTVAKSVRFTAQVGRFVRLVALSEIRGHPSYASAAEVNILGTAAPVPTPTTSLLTSSNTTSSGMSSALASTMTTSQPTTPQPPATQTETVQQALLPARFAGSYAGGCRVNGVTLEGWGYQEPGGSGQNIIRVFGHVPASQRSEFCVEPGQTGTGPFTAFAPPHYYPTSTTGFSWNENFFDFIVNIANAAKNANVYTVLILFASGHWAGATWDEQLYLEQPNPEQQEILNLYVDKLLARLEAEDLKPWVLIEPHNEAIAHPDNDAWQESLIARAKDRGFTTIRSPYGDKVDDYGEIYHWTDLHNSAADMISVSFTNQNVCDGDTSMPDASSLGFGKPVIFDTDHTCAGHDLTAEAIWNLYNKGYHILAIDTEGHDAEALAAAAGGGGTGDTAFVTSYTTGTLRHNFTGWVGMRIVANQAITVSELGRAYFPNSTQAHAVRITDKNGTLLGQVTVPLGTPGTINYATLGTPVHLAAGQVYYIVSHESDGGDDWYDQETSTVSHTGVADVQGGVYSSDGVNFVPVYHADQPYGPVNFKYSTA